MATLFNQTNLAPGAPFASGGGGGGSNFPNGLTVLTNPTYKFETGGEAYPCLNIVDQSQGAAGGVQMGVLQVGTGTTNTVQITSSTISVLASNTNQPTNLLTINPSLGSSAYTFSNVNSMSGTFNTTATNADYTPLSFTLRPDQAAKGGGIQAVFQYDAVDTGANYAVVVGANNTTGFIGTVWPGYISMPMQVYGATISLDSDNETFFFCDGAAGALGTISTGVNFLSAQNNLSSITDPSKQYTADMTALWSTFASLYPDCVNVAR